MRVSSLKTFFFCYQQFFFFFSHTTQHNIQNTTKQNNRHILHISKSNQREGEREGQQEHKVTPLYNHVCPTKTLPSINGRGPGPTDSRRVTFTWHYMQEATDPICFSTHVWCKSVLDYCLLCSCKTSKQHTLLHWTNTETRIIIKKTQTWVTDQSIHSNDDKTRFTCVHRLMTTEHSQTYAESAWWCSVTYMAVQIWL